jgi:membrane protein implicated in regulation of membrane protease activity
VPERDPPVSPRHQDKADNEANMRVNGTEELPHVIDFLIGLGFWNWFFLAILLFALETIIPGVHFLWFGLAAAMVGLLVVLLAGAGVGASFTWPLQLVLFAVISVATVFWVKRYAKPDMSRSDEPDLNVRGAQYIGRRVTVEEAIVSGRGKVRVGDTIWPAQGEDAAKGSLVQVVGVNGTVLVVEREGDD